jgi:hypothetical protein
MLKVTGDVVRNIKIRALGHVLLGLVVAVAGSPATSQQLNNSSGNYDVSLGQVYGAIRAVKRIKDICNEDFPQQREKNERAYAEWRSKRLSFLQEMERHLTRSMWLLSKGDPELAAENEATLQKNLAAFKENQRQIMSSGGREVYESQCGNYETLIRSQQWDIEKSFAEQVATIRRGPQ